MIVWEINSYYNFMVRIDLNKYKWVWYLVIREEMEVFIGIIILMGIIKFLCF